MRFPAGPVKRIYLNRAAAAAGEAAWAIRVAVDPLFDPGAAVTYLVREWRAHGACHGRGGLGDAMLTPTGPAYWLETQAEIETFA